LDGRQPLPAGAWRQLAAPAPVPLDRAEPPDHCQVIHPVAGEWWGSAKAVAGETRSQIPPPRLTGHTAAQKRALLAACANGTAASPLTAG